jgi:hypothetical protein
VRFGVVRTKLERAVEALQRFSKATESLESIATIGIRFCIVGSRRQRLVVARHRLLVSIKGGESVAAIVQRQKIIWTSLQREVYPPHSLGMIASLMTYNAEQVQAVEMIGSDGKNAIVDFLRIRQAAGLMQCQSFAE